MAGGAMIQLPGLAFRPDWVRVLTKLPEPHTIVMVTGDSGYRTTPVFLTLAYYDPAASAGARWRSVTHDALADAGWHPSHWAEPILFPAHNPAEV